MIEYKVRADDCECEGIKYVGYGVDALCDGELVMSYSDLFFDRHDAVKFVELLNREEVELVHLYDVIYDRLIET